MKHIIKFMPHKYNPPDGCLESKHRCIECGGRELDHLYSCSCNEFAGTQGSGDTIHLIAQDIT